MKARFGQKKEGEYRLPEKKGANAIGIGHKLRLNRKRKSGDLFERYLTYFKTFSKVGLEKERQ